MQYYISLHLTFRRPNLQEHCEIQNQSKSVRLEQGIIVIDQALHAKATGIAWKHTSIHANVMDTFHTIANLLASNGKRFQDVEFILNVGMRDICIPGIIAEGRIFGVSY